jgi:tetratricopeptide (TPR) repeat protein
MARLPSAPDPTPDAKSPPTAPTLTPQEEAARFARMLTRIDLLSALVVVALAFLMASFVARNSDLWQHLAVGKLVATGQYHFGHDPFGVGTANVYWANHAWLFDTVAYELYTLSANGAAVVAFKAILVALTALVMLLACRPAKGERIAPGSKADPTLWFAVLFTGVALVAMGPRMLLQPVVVSYLFTAVTFWLLNRDRENPSIAKLAVPLGILFAVWVNCDAYFIVGPVLVALTLVGEALQRVVPGDAARRVSPARLKALAVALGVGLVACLISPHHVHAFGVPPDFANVNLAPGFVKEPAMRRLFGESYSEDFWRDPGFGENQVGACAAVLVLAGAIAFALNVTQLQWGLLLPWLAMLALAALRWRLIPFFAVVAVPALVQNVHAFFARRPSRSDALPDPAGEPAAPGGGFTITLPGLAAFGGLLGRLFTLALGLVALALAYPGWLHVQARPDPTLDRHVAWAVEPNGAYRDLAEQFPKWQTASLLPPGANLFCFSLDVAGYLSWYAPGERNLIDYRFAVTGGASDDFIRARRGMTDAATRREGAADDWTDILARRGITHVVLTGTGNNLTRQIMLWMLGNEAQWTLWYLNGQTAVFAWRPAAQPALPTPSSIDPVRQGFGPQAVRLPLPTPNLVAFPASMADLPRRREFLDRYLSPPPIPSHDADVGENYALLYLVADAKLNHRQQLLRAVHQFAIAASEAGLGPGGYSATLFANPLLQGEARGKVIAHETREDDSRVLGLALLGVRETWRAVLGRPDQAFPYLELAQVYDYLPPVSPELRVLETSSLWHQGLTRLTAEELDYWHFEQLVTESYLNLSQRHMSGQQPYRDLAAECLEQALKTFRKSPPRTITPDQVERAEEFFQKQLDQLQQKELPARRERYLNESANKPPVQQADLALAYGLVREALKVLESNPSKLDVDVGVPMLIQIYINLGQGESALAALDQVAVPDVRESDPKLENQRLQRRLRFQQLRIRALIVAGYFAEAGREIDSTFETFKTLRADIQMHILVARTAAGLALTDPTGTDPLGRLVTLVLNRNVRESYVALRNMMDQATAHHAMRGMLALEEGDGPTALKHLKEAVEPTGSPPLDFPGRANALRYVEILKTQFPNVK